MSVNFEDGELAPIYLSKYKMELIEKYLEDQIRLIPASNFSTPAITSEAASSPRTTPIPEPKLELSQLNQTPIQNSYSEIYRTFALPLIYNMDSTEDRVYLGLVLIDHECNYLPPIKEALKDDPNEHLTNKSARYSNNQGIERELSKNNNINNNKPVSILSSFYYEPENRIPNKRHLLIKELEEPKMISKRKIDEKKQKRSMIPQFISNKLSNHRIILPKLERTRPSDIVRKKFDNFNFSEKEFLGLNKEQRRLKIYKILDNDSMKDFGASSTSRATVLKKSKFFNADNKILDQEEENTPTSKRSKNNDKQNNVTSSIKDNPSGKIKSRDQIYQDLLLGPSTYLEVQSQEELDHAYSSQNKHINLIPQFDKNNYLVSFNPSYKIKDNILRNGNKEYSDKETNNDLNNFEQFQGKIQQPSKHILGNLYDIEKIWR
ncbi:hypothetical protein K502DRAFT_345956 [Neoconidiobolus thromboides FSU 785]|nr:hypothetical protein K502DRAFT_345956 [Neoconidiobolus thromboides FSU 785]